MITRIELTNFMSHTHTVIEPAAGLTVLVGQNNCGKSAVVAALQILCHNENSTYVLRHGEKECSVKVTTDDGHTIEWRRKNSPSYVIDGQLFDRLRGAGLPDELHRAVRLPYVDAGGEGQFDVHFAEQKSPIFLLDQSPATAAKFFSSSSDAYRLLQMQRRHKEKVSQRQRDKNRLEAESRQLNAELETLEPAVELEGQLKEVEQLHGLLVQEAIWLTQAERSQVTLAGQLNKVAQYNALAQTLALLNRPPELLPAEPLENLATKLERAQVDATHALARTSALASLPLPPALADEVGLAATIQSQTRLAAIVHCEQIAQRTLQTLSQPPTLADTTDLSLLVNRLEGARRESLVGAARQTALSRISEPPGLSNTASLDNLVAKFVATERQIARWAESAGCSAINAPPIPDDLTPLAECVTRLESVTDQTSRCTIEFNSAIAELATAESALREFAASELCPTCGGPLDAERLLAGTASRTGGHRHG